VCYLLAAAWPVFYGMDFVQDNWYVFSLFWCRYVKQPKAHCVDLHPRTRLGKPISLAMVWYRLSPVEKSLRCWEHILGYRSRRA